MGYMGLVWDTGVNMGLLRITGYCGLEGVTGVYMGLHGVTGGYMRLLRVIEG